MERLAWTSEEIEADYLGLSVRALRAIRQPQKRVRQPAKRTPGNKYVKFYSDKPV